MRGREESKDTERKETGTMFQKPDSSATVGYLSGRGCLTASYVLDNKSRKKKKGQSVTARRSPVTSKKAQECGGGRLQRIKE